MRKKRKTRYEGKISANESKGFLLLWHCLRKKWKEAVAFAGNKCPRQSRGGHNPLQ